MKVNKITVGFVVQQFDDRTGKWIHQEFVASDDDVTFENEDGDVLDDGDFNEPSTELTLDMVQPS
jgi:hypothetical protein